eukprot:1158290-Pelagomonas_calceolata.AAC.7
MALVSVACGLRFELWGRLGGLFWGLDNEDNEEFGPFLKACSIMQRNKNFSSLFSCQLLQGSYFCFLVASVICHHCDLLLGVGDLDLRYQ